MGKLRNAAILFLLLAGQPALTGAAPAQPANARQLLRTVDSALAGVSEAARKPGDPKLATFLSVLERMRLRVKGIGNALAQRDEEFFVLVDQGSTDLGALRVAWARAGVGNEEVAAGLRIASAAYRMLRASYGREGLRHRQGGGLGEAEKRQFQRLQRAQRQLADSLLRLREGARRRSDRATVAELDRLRETAARIVWAPLDLEAYLNSLIAVSEMRGEWEVNADSIRDDAAEDLAAANAAVQELYVDADIGHVFTVDLGKNGGWSSLDGEAAAPADAPEVLAGPGAVELYQPSEEEGEEELLSEDDEDAEPVEEVEVYAEALEEAFLASEPDEEALEEDEAAAGEPLEAEGDAAIREEEDLPEETAAPTTGDEAPAATPPPAESSPNARPIG